MSLVNLEAINMIPQMMEKIDFLNMEIMKIKNHLEPKYDLTKRSGVMKFLKISDSTVSRYIESGIFIEGYHFYKEIKGKKSIITFVSGAIEEFKNTRKKK